MEVRLQTGLPVFGFGQRSGFFSSPSCPFMLLVYVATGSSFPGSKVGGTLK
jgi:hypothetical protein